MSTLSPAQEQTVARAIEWALTDTEAPKRSGRGWLTSSPGSGDRRALEHVSVSVSVPKAHRNCLFCGRRGFRVCPDCDDLPALDYRQGQR